MLKEPVAKRRWAFEIRCSTFEINIEHGISNDDQRAGSHATLIIEF